MIISGLNQKPLWNPYFGEQLSFILRFGFFQRLKPQSLRMENPIPASSGHIWLTFKHVLLSVQHCQTFQDLTNKPLEHTPPRHKWRFPSWSPGGMFQRFVNWIFRNMLSCCTRIDKTYSSNILKLDQTTPKDMLRISWAIMVFPDLRTPPGRSRATVFLFPSLRRQRFFSPSRRWTTWIAGNLWRWFTWMSQEVSKWLVSGL